MITNRFSLQAVETVTESPIDLNLKELSQQQNLDSKLLDSPFMSIDAHNCSLTNMTSAGDKNATVCTTTYVYRWRQWQTYLPLLVQIASTGLCYYFARLGCKLCMQRISFSIPLSLTTPVSVAIIITVCWITCRSQVSVGAVCCLVC